MSFAATWMDLEIIILSEVGQRERQILYDITYMWTLKKKTIYKIETDSHRKQTYGYQRGKEGID